MRVTITAVTGEGVQLDLADPGPFIALAGRQFLSLEDNGVLVRTNDGHQMLVFSSWWAIRDESGKVYFNTPDRVVTAGTVTC